MTRREATVLLGVAMALVIAGLTWLFGPYGLLGAGVALTALTLFVFDIREERAGGVPVADPARPLARR